MLWDNHRRWNTVYYDCIFFTAIQTETIKVKQKIKAQKEKEKAAYAKMFA